MCDIISIPFYETIEHSEMLKCIATEACKISFWWILVSRPYSPGFQYCMLKPCESLLGAMELRWYFKAWHCVWIFTWCTEVSIVSVDLLVDKNEEQCRTDQYESEKYLILRRGADIQFQVSGFDWNINVCIALFPQLIPSPSMLHAYILFQCVKLDRVPGIGLCVHPIHDSLLQRRNIIISYYPWS